MAGGKGKIHEHPNAGSNSLKHRPQDICKTGSAPSVKNQLKKLMNEEGWISIPKKDFRMIEDGSIEVLIPTGMALALKVLDIAMNGKDNTHKLKAIQMIMEQIDGKPKQQIGFDMPEIKPIITKRI